MGTKMAGGTAPCLVSMQSRRIAGYTQGMVPLDDLIHKNNLDSGDFDTTILKGLSGMDGHQYALPYDYGPSIVWYNSDLFQQDGVPAPKVGWTVADFMAAAKATTRDGKYGIAPYPDDTLFPLVLSWTGGTPVSSSGQLQLTTPQMVQGVQQVADMVAKDKDSPQIPGVNSTWSQDQFESGNVAMYVSGPWDASDLKAKTKFHFAPATIPAGPAGMHTDTAGSGFGISKACKDPDDAFKALSVMTSKETLAKLGQQGRAFPARRSVQDSWYQNANLPGAKDVLDAANASAQALPHTKNWAQVGNLLAQYGIAAFNGQSTVASALQQVQSQGSQGS